MRKIIYKYIDCEGAEKAIENSTIKFKLPSNFNDPFEFHENLIDTKICNSIIEETIKKYYPDLTRKELRHKRNLLIKEKDELTITLEKQLEESKKSSKISCFSENKNNILMWSHYAQKHEGACIGYKSEDLKNVFTGDSYIGNVLYKKKINPISFSKYKVKAIEHWILSKSIDWRYEEEIRIVLGSNPSDIIAIDPKIIIEIIFGCKSKPEFKERIENMIREKHFDWIKLTEMTKSDKDYVLIEKNWR